MDEDDEVYARIEANTAAARRIESFSLPSLVVEPIMSINTVVNQRAKALLVAQRLRDRAASWTDGPHTQVKS
jgi:hypothetical protein